MVITDYLIETHSFFECPLQKLRLYDDIEIFYRYRPNKRGLFVIEYATIVKKQSKTAGFFLRFHIFKSGVSYSSGPVITKCGF